MNTAADALSRTSFLPSSKVNEDENQDDYLLYPDIDDIYLVGSNESSTDPFNEMKLENWKLETKKDYPLSLIMGHIKSGKLPLPTERRQLPPSANLYLRWAKYLFVQDELVYIRKPVENGKLGPPRICVPRDQQTDLIHKAHKGHLGIEETLNKLRNRSYFPNMEEHVTQIINN